MTLLLNCVIQVTVILSIALMSLPLLRKKSAAVRHCVLTTAIVFSILTPVFNLIMPVWNWSAAVSAFVSEHPSVAPIHNRISAITSPATRALTQPQRMPNRGAGDDVTAVTGYQSERSAVVGRLKRLLSLTWAVGVLGGTRCAAYRFSATCRSRVCFGSGGEWPMEAARCVDCQRIRLEKRRAPARKS